MKQQNSQDSVMLADNFPSKTFLLVTHLTETDPSISRFSADGTSFEIYDQSIFAQKYLPQYFKHSNYGSFVRQLNLYGFTSSRLKQNNDVVVWTHAAFQKDRQDLLKDIKRTKKNKSSSSKPSHVHISNSPRSPSPHSLSDDVSSDNTTNAATKISRNASSGLTDHSHSWFASEFATLKQQNLEIKEQNRCLEQKLDLLLQFTFRVSADEQLDMQQQNSSGKRRRMNMSPVESDHVNKGGLDPIYEEKKEVVLDVDRDDYIQQHQQLQQPQYEAAARKMPPPAATNPDPAVYDFEGRDESLKRFVDIMLHEDYQEEEGECKLGHDKHDEQQAHEVQGAHHKIPESESLPTNNFAGSTISQVQANNVVDPPPLTQDILDDELMEEAMNVMLPCDDEDGDLFPELTEVPQEQQLHMNSTASPPTERVTMMQSNAVIHKADPEPIRAISPEVPTLDVVNDIEEGYCPEGVTVIAAHAELVRSESNESSPNHEPLVEELRRDRRERRRVFRFIACVGVVLAAVMTTLAVVITKRAKSTSKKSTSEANNKNALAGRIKNCLNKHGRGCGGVDGGGHGGGHMTGSSEDNGWNWNDGEGEEEHGFGGRWERNDNDEADNNLYNSTTDVVDEEDNLFNKTDEQDDEEGGEADESSPPSSVTTTQISRTHNSNVNNRMRKRIKSLFDDSEDGSASFSIALAGIDFTCTQGGGGSLN